MKRGVLGGSQLWRCEYRTSKQKTHMSGRMTIPFCLLGCTVDPLQQIDGIELLSFCRLTPQQPVAMLKTNSPQGGAHKYRKFSHEILT